MRFLLYLQLVQRGYGSYSNFQMPAQAQDLLQTYIDQDLYLWRQSIAKSFGRI